MSGTAFPDGFLWGAATSAYQIEGAAAADGRGESIWDRFCRTPGKVRGGDTGDVACDHYQRYEQDIDLMRRLGLRAYRFSLSWPRIQPNGSGAVNHAGIDFYRRLLERLLDAGLVPVATLYHWDLPQPLEDLGGWPVPDIAGRFADYARIAADAFGDLVDLWITINEPRIVAFAGYGEGTKAPGVTDWSRALRAAHNTLVAHRLATEVLRTVKGAQVGIALDPQQVYPASGSDADDAAADRFDAFHNRWFLDPVLLGTYPRALAQELDRRVGPLEFLAEPAPAGDRPDFLGINFYSRTRVRASRNGGGLLALRALPPQARTTAMGWEVVPAALSDLLLRLTREYGNIPIYITENGAAYQDERGSDGVVEDPDRVRYLREHLSAVASTIEADVPVKGYFVWSLLDNFEWEHGYSKRFGIVYVDYRTQTRIAKRSALWYRDAIAANAVPEEAG